MTPRRRKQWGRGFLLFLFLLWAILARLINRSYLLPGPADVLRSLRENREALFLEHLPATLSVMALGLFLSLLLGTCLAVLMDLDARIEKSLYPFLSLTQTVPVLCLAPVFVLWFGYTLTMRVVVVVLMNFFTVTVNLFDGFRSVKPGRTELLRTYGASRLQQYRLLRFPTALPYFFTALRVALPWSAVGTAVSEWLGAPAGLGAFSKSAMASLDASGLLAPLLLLTAAVLLLNRLTELLEGKLTGGTGNKRKKRRKLLQEESVYR